MQIKLRFEEMSGAQGGHNRARRSKCRGRTIILSPMAIANFYTAPTHLTERNAHLQTPI